MGVCMMQAGLYWCQESANQTGPVSMNVNAAVVLSAAVELVIYFRNSFYVPELCFLYPG